MNVGFRSDKGKTRANNEDACYVFLKDKVYVVCDGVGGGNAGEIASRTAVNEIANYIVANDLDKAESKYAIVNYFQGALDSANRVIFEKAKQFEENKGMATTAALLYVKDAHVYIANVGDSRVYLLRNKNITQLTEDHTYVNTLLKAGIISEEQALRDRRKNVITRALGADKTVDPDFFQLDIKKDDVFIICTDGLYDEVSEEKMVSIVGRSNDMSESCQKLIDEANKNGGRDNITVICVEVTEEDIDEH